MKNLFYFSLFFLLISSCTVKKKPVFIKIDNLKVMSFAADTIYLKAAVFFENPNDLGGTFSTDEVKVIINDEELARVSSSEFKVPARKQFAMPLKIVIPTKKILESNKNGILGSLVNSILNKSLKVQLKGDIKYKVLGYSSIYSIDNTQQLKIKL